MGIIRTGIMLMTGAVLKNYVKQPLKKKLKWLLYDVNRPHFSHFISVPWSWMASYAAQVWVEFTREISDQNCTTWSSITTSLHPFWNHKFSFYLGFFSLYKCFVDPAVSLFVESCKSCFFIFLQFDLFL